jgi:ElaB/YqjD/DUF883 family membrane-anchored ribosome-binding protein
LAVETHFHAGGSGMLNNRASRALKVVQRKEFVMVAAKAERSTEPRSPQDLEADIEVLKEEIAKLAKQLQAVGEQSYGTARRAAKVGVNQFKARGEETIEDIRESVADMEQQLTARVREKPVTSLAIAAGVGFLFALLTRR